MCSIRSVERDASVSLFVSGVDVQNTRIGRPNKDDLGDVGVCGPGRDVAGRQVEQIP